MWKVIIKQLKNLINSKLFLYLVIGGLVYFWYLDRQNLAENVNRLSRNQEALVLHTTEQVEITKREFQKLYHKEDSIAKSIGIKSNQVQQVIVNNYHYKDTSIVQFPLEEHGDTLKFIKPIGCIQVEGYVLDKNITFTKTESIDTLTTILYGKRPHKFLFFKWGKWVIDAKTYSACKQDTIHIEKNLKIN